MGLDRRVLIALATVYLVWSSTYYALLIAVKELPALLMSGTRYLIAGAILFAFGKLRGARWPSLREWLWAVPVGALLFLIGNGFVALAEVHLPSAIAAVVVATMPMFAALMAPMFGEKSRGGEWLGMGLGLGGVLVLCFNGELQAHAGSAALLFIAPISWAIGSMLARKVPVAQGILAPATQMIAGGFTMLLGGLVHGERVPPSLSARGVLAVVYLIVFGSLAGFSAYSYLLKSTRPALAMSYSYVNPPLAVLVGAALGREHVGPEMLASVALIGAGTFALLRAART
ncbi:MAG: drug/metabolite exporter YedA [Archangiaceae bacterium]|nr:drug/metabolite exporter YedA [Archangiaceae bacterium]